MRPKIYLINLDRSADRRRFMENQARTLGIAFERVSAIDGAALAAETLEACRERSAHPLTAGEIGCWLSHREAWRQIHAAGEAWALILEDDVRISPDLPEILGQIDSVPADANIIKLDTSLGVHVELSRRAAAFGSRKLHRLRRNSWGSAGYLISARLCGWLLDNARPVEAPIDLDLFSPRSRLFRAITTYVMAPAPVVQEQHLARLGGEPEALQSVILLRREARRRARPRAHRKILREIGRAADQARALFAYRRLIDWR